MATFPFQGPDGKTYNVEAENREQAAQAFSGYAYEMNNAKEREYAGLGGMGKAVYEGAVPGALGMLRTVRDVTDLNRLMNKAGNALHDKLNESFPNVVGKRDPEKDPYKKLDEGRDASQERAMRWAGGKYAHEVPESVRASYYFGNELGAAAPVAAIGGLAGLGAKFAGSVGIGGLSSGSAAATAEHISPGNDTLRTAMSIGVPLAGSGVAYLGGKLGGRGAGQIQKMMDAKGAAGKQLVEEMVAKGEDPRAILAQLETLPNATPATMTGSQVFADTAENLARKNANFGRMFRGAEDEALAAAAGRTTEPLAGADPRMLAAGVQEQSALRAQEAAAAEARAAQHMDTVLPNPMQVQQAGQDVQQAVQAGRAASSDRVKAAYGASIDANPNMPVPRQNVQNFLQTYHDALQQLGHAPAGSQVYVRPTGSLSDELINRIEDIQKRFATQSASGSAPVTVGEIDALNKRLRAEIQALQKSPNPAGWDVSLLKRMREAGQDSLRFVPGYDKALEEAARHAGTYNKADAVRGVLQPNAVGALRPGETVAEWAMTGAGAKPNLAVQQLSVAADSLPGQKAVQEGLETGFLSNIRARVQDAENAGMPSSRGVARVLQNEADTLTVLPGAEQKLRAAQPLLSEAEKARDAAKLAQGTADEVAVGVSEKPGAFLGKILGGAEPEKNLSMLIRAGGEQGAAGMRGVLFDFVQGAGTPDKMAAAWMQPIRSGGPTLADFMKSKGVLTTTEHAKIVQEAKQILGVTEARAAAVGASGRTVQVGGPTSDLLNFGLETVGARVGAQLGAGTSGASLKTSALGSKLAKMWGSDKGVQTQREILEKAFTNTDGHSVADLLRIALDPKAPASQKANALEFLKRNASVIAKGANPASAAYNLERDERQATRVRQ